MLCLGLNTNDGYGLVVAIVAVKEWFFHSGSSSLVWFSEKLGENKKICPK